MGNRISAVGLRFLLALFIGYLAAGMVSTAGQPLSVVAPQEPRTFPSKGARVIRFIEANCVHTKGEFYRKPFRLLPWQKRWIMALFEVDPDTMLRRVKWALLGVPKKNGKTELIAALGLYFLVGDGENTPKVVCAASTRGQAGLLFEAATIMVEESAYSRNGLAGRATLAQFCEVMASSIVCPSNRGEMFITSGDAGSNDGGNLSAVLLDEIHEWKATKAVRTWTTLTGGITGRRQGIIIQITTAGSLDDPDAKWLNEYKLGDGHPRNVPVLVDDDYLWTWYEYEGERDASGNLLPFDHRDPAVWAAANPSWEDEGMADVLRATLTSLVKRRTRNQFLRYHLNLATLSDESWLEDGQWPSCRVPFQELPLGHTVWAALDGSRKHDTTTLTWGGWVRYKGRDRFLVRARIWAPPVVDGKRVKGWRVPQAEVENAIRTLMKDYELRHCAYDPYAFERNAQTLEDEGIPMLEFPQHPARTSAATATLHEMIRNAEIAHEGAPDLAHHVEGAATVIVDANAETYRLSKKKSGGPIDGAVSLAMLVQVAVHDSEDYADVPLPGVKVL